MTAISPGNSRHDWPAAWISPLSGTSSDRQQPVEPELVPLHDTLKSLHLPLAVPKQFDRGFSRIGWINY